MKLKYSRWRNKAYKYLREANRPMTAAELLEATGGARSPSSPRQASFVLIRDPRFFCYESEPRYIGEGYGNRRVNLYEVYDHEE